MNIAKKKYIAAVFAAVIALACLPACAGSAAAAGARKEKLRIVTTIFPAYDWVREILGSEAGRAEITMLLDKGVDLHSYQPTAEDVLKISDCDMFVYVGGESDEWAESALKAAKNKDMAVISLLRAMGGEAKTEEITAGMQREEGHAREAGGEERAEEPEYDEHVWLSLKNAARLCSAIAGGLSRLDPGGAAAYGKNLAAYREKLAALDEEYRRAAGSSARKTLLFGGRFPFRYLTDDYGLSYYAAFAGCSAETEASFETVAFLAGKADELSLSSVVTIEKSDRRIAETIVKNTRAKNQKILTLDSMQSKTAEDIAAGATYLSVMKNNLAVLKEALRAE